MSTARSARRGPGEALRPWRPVAWKASVLALALITVASPSDGAGPRGDPQPPALMTRVGQGTARPPAADPTTDQEIDQLVATGDLNAAHAREELEALRAAGTVLTAALTEAEVELDLANAAQAEALSAAGVAQEAMMQARVRLGDLITASDSAVAELNRASARVESSTWGSKAHRSAFTVWQMAAVAERAAHARRSAGAELGAALFEELESAEAGLAGAEITLGEARSAHRRAERAATAAAARVVELEAVVPAADATATPASPTRVTPPVRASEVGP